MSSARKRAAIRKANREADNLRQRLMLAEHHANVMESFARLAAARSDELLVALEEAKSVCLSVSMSRDRRIVRDGCILYAQTEEWCKWVEDEVAPKLAAAIAKFGAGRTAPEGHNAADKGRA